jgi:hypothetical protein
VRSLAIEINDAGLVVVDESGVVYSEPGFAVVNGKEILTGNSAFAEARLRPRATSSSHWASLSIEPGSSDIGRGRSTAELAYAQLDKLWQHVGDKVDHVVFVVPSTFKSESLGVLLGLAEECGIPTGAIVDAAAAASRHPYPDQQLVYVDADLHSVYVTKLDQSDHVTAETPTRLDSIGLNGVKDAFARRIGQLFVLETRFDPFHEARTEQQVYAGLSNVLGQIQDRGTASLELTRGDESFKIEIGEAQLLGAAQGFYRAIRQLIAQNRHGGSELVVQLSDRLAELPGIDAELARLDATTVVELEPGHAGRSVLAAADALDLKSESVTYFRHMPWRGQPVPQKERTPAVTISAAPSIDDYHRPTHVVYRGIAYPVNGEGVVIGRSKLDHRRAILLEAETQGVSRAHCELSVIDGELRLRDLSSYGTFVNERRIEGDEILKPADIIRIGSPGAELVAIRVEESDGA